jgi:L-ribulose-5-phosphate 3-epimerase UlaE
MRKACELALSIGVQVIQIAGYDVYYKSSTETTRAFFMENLARSVEYAAGTGVVLAFETMETPFMNTVQKAMDWIKKINSPWLKVYPDLGNITNAAKSEGGDVMQDLETGRGNIAALHLKESKPNVFREVPYGTGHVDFASVCLMGRSLGVGLYVGEFWHKGEENWQTILHGNAAFLKKHLNMAYEDT